MSPILSQILPIFMLFGLGILLREVGVLEKSHGQVLIKIIFYIALPGLVLHAFSTTTLKPEFFFLPLLAVLMHLAALLTAWFTGRVYRLSPQKFGVYLTGSMIINVGFVLPFVVAGYGNAGMARLAMIDLGNGTMTFSLVYYLACRYGQNATGRLMLQRFVKAPPVWAILIGIGLNMAGVSIPEFLTNFFRQAGNMTSPILLLSLGLFFRPRFQNMRYIVSIILIRALTGLGIALAGIAVFNISGITREVLLLASVAPVGFNVITFASLEKLDEQFAATLVSFGIIVGIILMPLLLLILKM